MPTSGDTIHLAALADTIATLRAEQRTVLAILTKLMETATAQTEMLADILVSAQQERGPSEAVAQLAALTAAVQVNSDAIGTIGELMATLPEEIGAEIARAVSEMSAR